MNGVIHLVCKATIKRFRRARKFDKSYKGSELQQVIEIMPIRYERDHEYSEIASYRGHCGEK